LSSRTSDAAQSCVNTRPGTVTTHQAPATLLSSASLAPPYVACSRSSARSLLSLSLSLSLQSFLFSLSLSLFNRSLSSALCRPRRLARSSSGRQAARLHSSTGGRHRRATVRRCGPASSNYGAAVSTMRRRAAAWPPRAGGRSPRPSRGTWHSTGGRPRPSGRA